MKIMLIGCAFIGALTGRYRYMNWHNPYSIFNILWIIVGMLLLKGNDFIYEPSMLAMEIVVLGILGFNLSILIPRIYISNQDGHKAKRTIDYDRIQILSYIVLILSIISAVSAIQSIFNGVSFTDIRTDYYTYSSKETVWMYYLRNYFLFPMRYVLIITSIISFFNKMRKKSILINTFLIVILQAVTSGGRYVLLNTIFMIISGGLLFNVLYRFKKKQKIIMFCIIMFLIWGIIYLTNDRSTYLMQNMTTLERLEETIYQYFAGSLTYLGEMIKEFPFVVGSTYGVNFFAGFFSPFFVFLNFFKILKYPNLFNIIGTYACQDLQIGPHVFYNALPTIFGYYYIDGGFIFTFLEAIFFGYICKRIYVNAKNGYILFVAYYILIFVQICNSSTRWLIYSSDYVLAFFYLMFFIRRTNSSSLEES